MSKTSIKKFTVEEDGAENIDDNDVLDSFVDRSLMSENENEEEEEGSSSISVDEQDEKQGSDFDLDQDSLQNPVNQNEKNEEVEDISFTPFVSQLVEDGILHFDPEKEYDDSEDGFAEIIRDTVNHEINEWKSGLSDLSMQLIEYIENNGTVEGFVQKFQETDYSSIDIEDETNQKNLIEEHLLATGLDEDEVKSYLRDYEDSGVLERQAKLAQKYLSKIQVQQRQEFVEEQKLQQERLEFERQAQMEELKNDIVNSNFKSFQIPKGEREKFFDYLTKPVTKDGKTKYLLEDSYEDRIKMAYMKYKNFDFSDIEKKAQTKASLNIKKQLTRYKDTNATRQSGISREEQNPENLKISSYWSNLKGPQEI